MVASLSCVLFSFQFSGCVWSSERNLVRPTRACDAGFNNNNNFYCYNNSVSRGNSAIPPSVGISPGEEWVNDAVGVNCEKGATTENQGTDA